MEPRIQYAQTADAVSIAFWTLGEGMPLVQMPWMLNTHLELEWQWPEVRRWHERLAQKRKLVRYDSRGCGLSDRDVVDFSLDAQVLDLEAVVDRLRLERFALFGMAYAGPVAIAYAARHPGRVSHLVLWCTWARTRDTASPRSRALRQLIDTDWETYTETAAHVALGWSEGEEAHSAAAMMRESVRQETARAILDATREFDVTALLPQVRSVSLVLLRRQLRWVDVAIARGLASRIPDARLTLLQGTSGLPYLGDSEAVLAAIDEFLGGGEEGAAAAEALAPGALRTVLFTDVAGSTSLTRRLGDAKAQEVLRTHNTIVRDALKGHSGSEIKHTGDGIMASFSSASRALECAIDIQRAFAQRNESKPDVPIRVRIGLNAGEPVAEEEDLFGTAVQLAARICAQAEPGEILAPTVVRELLAGKGFLFSDRGDVALRGFEDPVRLFEVRWREE
jgi:class 3 adenylate cyclase